ncbi:MAG: hypothetical protein WCV86_00185 [Patescibacteria group bacterium]|jgi:hypothetical protein
MSRLVASLVIFVLLAAFVVVILSVGEGREQGSVLMAENTIDATLLGFAYMPGADTLFTAQSQGGGGSDGAAGGAIIGGLFFGWPGAAIGAIAGADDGKVASAITVIPKGKLLMVVYSTEGDTVRVVVADDAEIPTTCAMSSQQWNVMNWASNAHFPSVASVVGLLHQGMRIRIPTQLSRSERQYLVIPPGYLYLGDTPIPGVG